MKKLRSAMVDTNPNPKQSEDEHLLTHEVGGTSIRCSCGKLFGTIELVQQHQSGIYN